MKNLSVRLISFKQGDGYEEWTYALNIEKRPLKEGDYIYNRNWGRFMAVQRCGKEMTEKPLHFDYQIIEATNNPKYSLPPIPETILKSYFDSNKQQTKFQLRID